MKRLAIDIGNTSAKWALFEDDELLRGGHGSDEMPTGQAERAMAVVSGRSEGMDRTIEVLSASTPLPISIDYKTPTTLGLDRVAGACGAWSLYRGEPCLIIDAGTCITVDFLDAAGVYHGGAIMAGLDMSLDALHRGTARLPLIAIDAERAATAPLLGRSTEESIVAGTLTAIKLAIAGFVSCYKMKAAGLRVVLTGGDAELIAASGASDWDIRPMLTLIGLNEIMKHNER